jgi:hypothetical protein
VSRPPAPRERWLLAGLPLAFAPTIPFVEQSFYDAHQPPPACRHTRPQSDDTIGLRDRPAVCVARALRQRRHAHRIDRPAHDESDLDLDLDGPLAHQQLGPARIRRSRRVGLKAPLFQVLDGLADGLVDAL